MALEVGSWARTKAIHTASSSTEESEDRVHAVERQSLGVFGCVGTAFEAEREFWAITRRLERASVEERRWQVAKEKWREGVV